MQAAYEHCVPKEKTRSNRRMALVFRHGEKLLVSDDSGQPMKEIVKKGESLLTPANALPSTEFGPMYSVLEEGRKFYTRRELYTLRGHL